MDTDEHRWEGVANMPVMTWRVNTFSFPNPCLSVSICVHLWFPFFSKIQTAGFRVIVGRIGNRPRGSASRQIPDPLENKKRPNFHSVSRYFRASEDSIVSHDKTFRYRKWQLFSGWRRPSHPPRDRSRNQTIAAYRSLSIPGPDWFPRGGMR